MLLLPPHTDRLLGLLLALNLGCHIAVELLLIHVRRDDLRDQPHAIIDQSVERVRCYILRTEKVFVEEADVDVGLSLLLFGLSLLLLCLSSLEDVAVFYLCEALQKSEDKLAFQRVCASKIYHSFHA